MPGRGAWVLARRDSVETALRKKAFARAFRSQTPVDPGLADLVDRLLAAQVLGGLGLARKAGAEDPKVSVARDIRRSEIEGREVFVEAMLTATASGRPRIADG